MSSSPRWSRTAVAAGIATCALVLALPAGAAAAPPAAGAPGDRHTWAPADKHGFGTAHDLRSRVWFTLRQAELTEVYFPDLSTPALRDLEFVVTDGARFADRETDAGVEATVEPVDGSLSFVQTTSTDRWRLTKRWLTDPRQDTVLAEVRFESLTGGPLELYVLADPAPGNDGNDDRAFSRGSLLVARDDDAANIIAAFPPLRRTTSGYQGTASDPGSRLTDLEGLGRTTDAREPGNVVQAARTALTGIGDRRRMRLAIGFGTKAGRATAAAKASLGVRAAVTAERYAAGWASHLDTLREPPASVAGDEHLRRLYEQSVMVLDASEDKTYRGASIASPSMPWVWGTLTLSGKEESGPYHLVWPRDFYHAATALEAAGDEPAADRLVDYLWRVQKPDGSWWQNTRVDGTPEWTGLQLDEVALPIVLAWWLDRTSASDWTHIEDAADFIVANGPYTPQERWENQDGYSPNSIAAQIAALVCAADVARKHGAVGKAATYEQTADEWQTQVEGWTATTTGPYSPDPYYLRLTKDGNPDDGSTYNLGDNYAPNPVDERLVVDQSFLGLVLWGVKPPDDPTVVNSLTVGDEVLAEDTPHGPIWHRFTFDGYGETRDGGDWDLFPTPANQTLGRVWPLLTGERGEYELLAGGDARPHLRTIGETANDGLMLPEQVWDGRPPTGEPGAEPGEGTRSATPLAWTHAQFIRLAWSIDAGTPIERPSIVACRYAGGAC